MATTSFLVKTGLIVGNLTVNSTVLTHGPAISLSAPDDTIKVSNSTTNTTIDKTSIIVSNTTANVTVGANQVKVANSTVSANHDISQFIVGSSIANSSGVYTPIVNAATHSVGATFTANATLVNAAAVNITGQTNTATIYITTSANLATNLVANTLGLYHTGVVNAASHSVGATFTANATLINAAAVNITGQTNTATIYITTSANLATNLVANTLGLYHTGVVNAATHSVGATFTANATLINAAAVNITGQTNTATLFVTTSANVGANVQLSTSTLLIGNSTINAIANSIILKLSNSTSNASISVPSAAAWAATNYFLHANGSWVQQGGGDPGGSNTWVQFNNSATFAGSAGFTFNKDSNNVLIANTLTVGNSTVNVVANSTTITANSLTLNGNLTINADIIIVGNSTVNATLSSTLVQVANSTATANLIPTQLKIGTTTVNSTAFALNGVNTAILSGNQNLTGGFTVTPNNLGVTGSFTANLVLGQYQYGTVNSAITITAPTSDGGCDIYLLNGSAAGTITFSGFTIGSTGDTYVTTNTYKFVLSIRRINSIATYVWKALQ